VKLLLDTHIWLWSLLEPERLTPRVATALEAADTELWLSPISIWETLMLADKDRIALEPSPLAWTREQIARLPFRQAAVTHEVALQTSHVDLAHRDPADRFIVATAQVYELTLVTADRRLVDVPRLSVLSNLDR